jgi:hypothetical protein
LVEKVKAHSLWWIKTTNANLCFNSHPSLSCISPLSVCPILINYYIIKRYRYKT